MGPEDLIARAKTKVVTQEYGKAPAIEGVVVRKINVMEDIEGQFCEILRKGKSMEMIGDTGCIDTYYGLPAFKDLQQASYSFMPPNAVKAFHLHYEQEDLWFIPPGPRLMVGLWDCRKDSDTADKTMKVLCGGKDATLIYIPRGVAHGYRSFQDPVTLVYFTNNQFDIEDPDERRLPANSLDNGTPNGGYQFWRDPV